MLDNHNEPSQQDIINRIKNLGSEQASEEEQPSEELEAVDVSEEDALSDELESETLEAEEFEELEEEEPEELDHEDDGEESYFDIDGEEITLSQIKEWKDSGLRQSDYTRKTQDLADQRKSYEAKAERADALIQNLGDRIDELDAIIKGEEAEINWDELAEDDPSEYLRKQRAIKAKQKALSEAKAQQKAKLNDRATEESQLLVNAMPSWKDSKVQDADVTQLQKYMADKGIKPDLLEKAGYDHRLYMALLKASKFDALQEKKSAVKKKVKRAPKAIKPVKGKSKAKPSEMEEAKARLKRTGSKDDAFAALKLLYK